MLEILGVPNDLIIWTIKLYHNFMVIIKAGKEEISIPYGCRVKQGDSLAPMLFIMAL